MFVSFYYPKTYFGDDDNSVNPNPQSSHRCIFPWYDNQTSHKYKPWHTHRNSKEKSHVVTNINETCFILTCLRQMLLEMTATFMIPLNIFKTIMHKNNKPPNSCEYESSIIQDAREFLQANQDRMNTFHKQDHYLHKINQPHAHS